jgi:hypothetical protein
LIIAVRVPPEEVPVAAYVKPAGRVSVIVTPVAVSVAFDALATWIWKLATPPSPMVAVEVVFVMLRPAAQPVTVTVAGVEVDPDPAFVEV